MENNQKCPLVTIAIPAYKRKFLKQAIASALNQTYDNIELVIVNDASPESLDDVVSEFHDPRIRYYVNESNLGGADPVANWNKCLDYAKGNFFALLCDDDVYDRNFVSEMLSLTSKYPDVSVFRSRVKMIDSNDSIIDLFPSSPTYESAMDYLWAKVSRNRIQTISEFLLRTSTMRKCGGYVNMPKAWCSDEISILEFAKDGGIVHSNSLLVSFRMSGDNISSVKDKNTEQKIIAQMRYTVWIKNFIKDEPAWFKNSIEFHRNCCLAAVIPEYLQYSMWVDFLSVFFQRKKYGLKNSYFLKALAHRFVYSIKNI